MAGIKYKEALGLEVKRGRPSLSKKPEKEVLVRLYQEELKSIREISEILGCTKDMVYRALQEHGIDRRSNACRSRLKTYSIKDLEKGVKAKGIRGYAKELGVHENTLRYYLRGVERAK